MAQVVSRKSMWDFGGQIGTRTGFSRSTPVFPSQYHSTDAPYRFIHLSLTLYNLSLLGCH
jgi:hypothetical protein